MLPSDAEKNSDSSRMAEKSATVAATIVVWPDLAVGLAGVLEHGHDQAERRRRERDRQQQRAVHPAGRVQAEARSGRRARA